MTAFGKDLPTWEFIQQSPPGRSWQDVKLAEPFDLEQLGLSVLSTMTSTQAYQECTDDAGRMAVAREYVARMFCRPTMINLVDAGRYAGRGVTWIPGHVIGERNQYFPVETPIMVIGKMPSIDDSRVHQCFTGPVGDLMAKEFAKCELSLLECYGTNVIKFYPPYANMKTVPAAWIREGEWLLRQEIAMVKPRMILLLGAQAVQSVMGKKYKITQMRGNIHQFGDAQVMVAASPSDMLKNPEKMPIFQDDIARFARIARGGKQINQMGDYYNIYNLDQLRQVVDMCMPYKHFAIDCEWAGESPRDGHLLTIQFSKAAKEAFVVVLRLDVDNYTFGPSPSHAIEELKRLLCRPDVGVCGHNFRADMKWLTHYGLDLTAQFMENGFDTMLAHHVISENLEHNLTACAMQDTSMGRYDAEVDSYLARKIPHSQMPSSVLLPYAAADADATFRLWGVYSKFLWDEHARHCTAMGLDPIAEAVEPEGAKAVTGWQPTRWNLLRSVVFPVNAPIAEMETVGLPVDKARIDLIGSAFEQKRDQFLAELRLLLNDPEFNPRSNLQLQRLFYAKPGSDAKDGNIYHCLGLTPYKTTGKPSKLWSECLAEDEVYWLDEPVYGVKDGERVMLKQAGWSSDFHSPAVDNESLLVYVEEHDCQEAEWLRSYKFLDQICKNFVATEEVDEYGELAYTKGLGAYIDKDGRIHGSFSQMSETGRYKSYDPNCQNWPKARESELSKIFKKDEPVPPIRTILTAPPGHVLMEADLESAELFTLAWLAGDKAMKADLNRRNSKGEKVSLHSIGALKYFKLNMDLEEFEAVRKKGGSEGKRFEGLRTAAKSVNFGIPYCRGAAAVARAVQREGVPCTKDDAQSWIDGFFEMYPEDKKFLDWCKESVFRPGHIITPWGRWRHFVEVQDNRVMAAQQREACNFPIQSTVADTVSRAILKLWRERNKRNMRFRIVLQVHDAILLEVPYEEVREAQQLLKWAMTDVVVPGCGLRYGVDMGLFQRWNEKIDPKLAESLGWVK
jgi:uracil-DNA glycosylase family 4